MAAELMKTVYAMRKVLRRKSLRNSDSTPIYYRGIAGTNKEFRLGSNKDAT